MAIQGFRNTCTAALVLAALIAAALVAPARAADDELTAAQTALAKAKAKVSELERKVASLTPAKPKPTTAAALANTVLWRNNKLEASQILFLQTNNISSIDAKGASFGLTRDYLKDTDALAVNSYLTWLPPGFSGDLIEDINPNAFQFAKYAIGPFNYLNGNLNEPFKNTERSAAQFGMNGEFLALVPSNLVTALVVSALPYYQTDFRGYAHIYGFDGLVEPYAPNIFLGSYNKLPARDESGNIPWYDNLFLGYWRLIGEANPVRVEDQGLTDFKPNTTYALLGGTVQLRAVLFPYLGANSLLCGRISVLASDSAYWDAVNQHSINNLHGEIDYDLSGTNAAKVGNCGPQGENNNPPEAKPGAPKTLDSSLALTYDNGTDKTTYVKQQKFMATLTVAY